MTTLLICLYVATLLPFLSKIPLGLAMKQTGHYDNAYPREQQKRLTGFGARALAAHQNSFEALILFGLAVLAVIATHHVSWWAECYAISFIITRIAYHALYLMGKPTLRTVVWALGFFCAMALMGLTIT